MDDTTSREQRYDTKMPDPSGRKKTKLQVQEKNSHGQEESWQVGKKTDSRRQHQSSGTKRSCKDPRWSGTIPAVRGIRMHEEEIIQRCPEVRKERSQNKGTDGQEEFQTVLGTSRASERRAERAFCSTCTAFVRLARRTKQARSTRSLPIRAE